MSKSKSKIKMPQSKSNIESKIKTHILDLSKQTKTSIKPIKRSNHIHFSDHPDFKPNLSPQDVLQKGSFGGTYYRPIYSQVVEEQLNKGLSSMSEHGMPTIGKILDNQLFSDISQQRGSFYTFILSFISDVEVTNQATIVKYSFTYIGVINWLFIIICLILSTLTARIVYLNKKDVFFDFALITTLMLIVYPRVNPHYYIFALFGIYYVTYIFFQYKEINKKRDRIDGKNNAKYN